VQRPSGLIKEGGETKMLRVRAAEMPNQSRDCFIGANICYGKTSISISIKDQLTKHTNITINYNVNYL